MKEFFTVMDVDQVLALVEGFSRAPAEAVGLQEATGRVLAEAVLAGCDLPGFARSTVDGYAVQAASSFGASEGSPALFDVIGTVAMGEEAGVAVAPAQAARIATGGALPPGADSVVMLEHADVLDERTIEVFRSVAPGQHVIAADEDYPAGAVVAAAGRRLRPQDTGVLAAIGTARVDVHRRPRVAIISTGDEIVPVDAVPAHGQIRDVNSFTLAGLVAAAGATPVALGIVPDDFEALRAASARALAACDMVLISGGSSVGARDFTVEVISSFADSRILAHGISISPGKPTILARVLDRPFWGLPGHVASAMIVFARIVRPFLLHIGGIRDPLAQEIRLPARLSRNLASAQGRTDFVRVRVVGGEEGLWAEPVLGKSGLLNTMVKGDGVIEIGKNVEGLEAGARVEVILF
ncbi:MAG: molybdopterin molybdotransferase MoeA [Desulfobacterales bacterium]|nr:molybdopterin molybdotransferase MoeA [Desulfobacterales bacterium]